MQVSANAATIFRHVYERDQLRLRLPPLGSPAGEELASRFYEGFLERLNPSLEAKEVQRAAERILSSVWELPPIFGDTPKADLVNFRSNNPPAPAPAAPARPPRPPTPEPPAAGLGTEILLDTDDYLLLPPFEGAIASFHFEVPDQPLGPVPASRLLFLEYPEAISGIVELRNLAAVALAMAHTVSSTHPLRNFETGRIQAVSRVNCLTKNVLALIMREPVPYGFFYDDGMVLYSAAAFAVRDLNTWVLHHWSVHDPVCVYHFAHPLRCVSGLDCTGSHSEDAFNRLADMRSRVTAIARAAGMSVALAMRFEAHAEVNEEIPRADSITSLDNNRYDWQQLLDRSITQPPDGAVLVGSREGLRMFTPSDVDLLRYHVRTSLIDRLPTPRDERVIALHVKARTVVWESGGTFTARGHTGEERIVLNECRSALRYLWRELDLHGASHLNHLAWVKHEAGSGRFDLFFSTVAAAQAMVRMFYRAFPLEPPTAFVHTVPAGINPDVPPIRLFLNDGFQLRPFTFNQVLWMS